MSHLSDPERERIRKLVAGAETEALLDLAAQAGLPGVQGHREAFDAANEAFENGSITWEEKLQSQIGIFQNVLQHLGTTKPQFKICPAKEVVEELVIQQRIDEALQLCAPLGDAALLLQAKYVLLQQVENTGLVEPAERELAMSRLSYALMELAEQLPAAKAAPGRSSCFARLRRFFAKRLFR